MAFEIDRHNTKEPDIQEMTDAALNILKGNPQGFFLMVEGGKIDWACHDHDVAGSVYDTLAFDSAVKTALDFAKKDASTLIVVVNDHETGGMAITAKVNIEAIKKLRASAGEMAKLIKKDYTKADQIMKEYTGIGDLTDDERRTIVKEARGLLKVEDEWGYGGTVIANIIAKRAGVGFSTGGHTGTPVIVAAWGKGCEIFNGFYDQADIPRKIAQLLGISLPWRKGFSSSTRLPA